MLNRRLLAAVIASATAIGTAALSAEAPGMALGPAAAAPAGFLDYCARVPFDCTEASDGNSVVGAERRRAAAMQLFWAERFSSGPPTVTATLGTDATPRERALPRSGADKAGKAALVLWLPSGVTASVTLPASALAGTFAPNVGEIASAAEASTVPIGDGVGAASATDEVVSSTYENLVQPASDPKLFRLDAAGWATLNTVNRRLNRVIRRQSDLAQYGREDVWQAPAGRNARGDCEDYVLAKRRALLAEGVPADALSIAVVETRSGEGHAVLLIASDKGEYVLDSLSPWVTRWDRVDYRWVERQAPGRVFEWVSLTEQGRREI